MKKRACCLWLIFALLLPLASCAAAKGQPEPIRLSVAYYAARNENTSELPVELYERSFERAQGVALLDQVLSLMREDPTPEWLTPLIPESMAMVVQSFADGRAVVNLSGGYLQAESIGAMLMDYGIVATLCGLPECNAVKLMRDGNRHPVYGDTYLTPSDFVVSESKLEPQPTKLFIYFPDPSLGGLLRRETHSVIVTGGSVTERYIMDELIRGPISDDLLPVMPEGTELLSVYTEKGVCYVNLSEEFVINRQGSDSEVNRAVYGIVDSLTELDYIHSVRFLIAGEAIRYYHGIIVEEPLVRREEYVSGYR